MLKKTLTLFAIVMGLFAFIACDGNTESTTSATTTTTTTTGTTTTITTTTSSNTVSAPDIIGMSVSEAKLTINGQFRVNEVEIPSNQYLPGTVISYGANVNVGDQVLIGSSIDVNVSALPENAYSESDAFMYVSEIGYVTGPDSPNYDVLRDAGVGGTDLGIPVKVGDKIILLYGDTFSGVGSFSGLWFSNFIAETTDDVLWDGLTFDSVVTNDSGMALPFRQGLHNANQSDEEAINPNREVTKIPTGGITIGDYTYVFYMSVRYWGVAGSWLVTYNRAIRSTDLHTWEDVEGLVWYETEAYNFGQIYPVEDPNDPDTIYLMAIPGGRNGGTVLARVAKVNFEDRDEYEYYVADNTWVKGDAGLLALQNDPYYIINPACSEMSAMYNEYLEQWMVVYLRGGYVIMQTADEITGPWSSPKTITTASRYPGLYGGFILPEYTDFDGQKFYIQLSRWLPIYQTMLIEVVLD
ncbi:MAG: DUF4185 domain-containing protein [Bacilli bacterium]|nr:DUF4185 domain-containing protein [Bacilli bacterium]